MMGRIGDPDTNPYETCPGCHGSKVQKDKSGIAQWCKLCQGTGLVRKRRVKPTPLRPLFTGLKIHSQ